MEKVIKMFLTGTVEWPSILLSKPTIVGRAIQVFIFPTDGDKIRELEGNM
jgi:hypothetical protein